MGIIKCEKVFDGIFTFSSLFEIKMKVFLHRIVRWENTLFLTHYNDIYSFFFKGIEYLEQNQIIKPQYL